MIAIVAGITYAMEAIICRMASHANNLCLTHWFNFSGTVIWPFLGTFPHLGIFRPYKVLTGYQWFLIIFLAATGTFGQATYSRAYQVTEVSKISSI